MILCGCTELVCAGDVQTMLAPPVAQEAFQAVVTEERDRNTLLRSADPAVWVPLVEFYVHECAPASVNLFRSLAADVNDDTKKRIFLRAADVAEKMPKDIVCEPAEFTRFVRSVRAAAGKARLEALDIGSGDGSFLAIARKFPWAKHMRIIGIDRSIPMIDTAFGLNMVNVRFMDAARLDFADETFALIFLNNPSPVFGIEELTRNVTEAYRVLKPGGGIVVRSCENLNDGFALADMLSMLTQLGFAEDSVTVYMGGHIPADYPIAGTSTQMHDRSPYMITARKNGFPGMSVVEDVPVVIAPQRNTARTVLPGQAI